MSRQLERLRDALGDELLLRSGSSYERTPRGERLLREIEHLLPRLEEMLQGKKFDPAVRRKTVWSSSELAAWTQSSLSLD
jgi:DNA-binding transcriptional LysR family regulator